METKKYENKTFLKSLSDEQLKELIVLCGKREKLDAFEKIQSSDDIYLQLPNSKEEWDLGNYLHISAYIGKGLALFQEYELNDFEMTECTGYSKKEYNILLREYLASQFGEEYTKYLFNKRVCDAREEEKALIDYYLSFKKEPDPNKVFKKV